MSLHPEPLTPVPADTARVAHAAFPKGNVYLRMRDEFGRLYTDEQFAALFPTRGQPAAAPWRLALTLVMQFAEGLSDRQAADAVRGRIDWKYALGLDLTDPGWDASVLSEFRARLVAGEAEAQLLDTMLARFAAAGLLRARGRQRTDATHVLAAIRVLNRLETVGETLRHALNSLAAAAPDWLRPQLDPAWVERYGARVDAARFPKEPAARLALAAGIGADGHRLLAAVSAPDAPPWLRQVPAVATLRRVWVQQYHAPAEDGAVQWRTDDHPPAARLIHSPYDVEARYSTKRTTTPLRGHGWTGYKAHLTETCDDDAPHLITHVETTPATTPDWHLPAVIHPALAAKGLLPDEHLLDAGYVDSGVLVASQADHGVRVIGPVPPDNHWQARAGQGFDIAGFSIDWEERRATCPQGQPSTTWSATHDQHGEPLINIRFSPAACRACGQRAHCTTSREGPREISLRPQAQHEALQAARRYQTTPEFKAEYARRAGIEGTISQGLRVCDLRQARYVGLPKVRLQHVLTAAGLNLRRLDAWWEERPQAQTRVAPFVKLARAAAA